MTTETQDFAYNAEGNALWVPDWNGKLITDFSRFSDEHLRSLGIARVETKTRQVTRSEWAVASKRTINL